MDRLIRFIKQGVKSPATLSGAGELLGRLLAQRNIEEVRAARADLARTGFKMPSEGDVERGSSFAAGYVIALADVAASFDAEVTQQGNVAQSIAVLRNTGAQEVVIALAEGLELPSAIAERCGKDRGSISRILGQLRAGGLVREFEGSPGTDGRSKPQKLTPHGEVLAAQLRPVLSQDAKSGIAFSLQAINEILRTRSIPLTRIAALAESMFASSAIAESASDFLRSVGAAAHLFMTQDNLLRSLVTRTDTDEVLTSILRDSVSDQQSILRHRLEQLMADGSFVVVRSDARPYEWQNLLATSRTFGHSMFLRQPMLDLDRIKHQARVAFVYDEARRYEQDIANPEMFDVLRDAKKLFVSTDSARVPQGMEPIMLTEIAQ